jgi:hypothetical protein
LIWNSSFITKPTKLSKPIILQHRPTGLRCYRLRRLKLQAKVLGIRRMRWKGAGWRTFLIDTSFACFVGFVKIKNEISTKTFTFAAPK